MPTITCFRSWLGQRPLDSRKRNSDVYRSFRHHLKHCVLRQPDFLCCRKFQSATANQLQPVIIIPHLWSNCVANCEILAILARPCFVQTTTFFLQVSRRNPKSSSIWAWKKSEADGNQGESACLPVNPRNDGGHKAKRGTEKVPIQLYCTIFSPLSQWLGKNLWHRARNQRVERNSKKPLPASYRLAR